MKIFYHPCCLLKFITSLGTELQNSNPSQLRDLPDCAIAGIHKQTALPCLWEHGVSAWNWSLIMFLFLSLAHVHCGEASFKYRNKMEEKWKEAVRKLAIFRTKGMKKMARSNLNKLKMRKIGKTEQGGLKSHISFRIWKQEQYSSANTCQIDWQNSILLAQLVPLGCVYIHCLLWGRAEVLGKASRSSPLACTSKS